MIRNIKSLFFLVTALSLTFLSCKDDDPVLFPNAIVSPYYFQIVVNGDTTTYQEDISNYGNIVGDFWGGPVKPSGYQYAPFTCIASAEAIANTNPETLTNSGAVAITEVSSFQRNTLSEYIGLPTTGEKGIGILAKTTQDSASSGGFISWFDKDGVEWNTNNGAQTNPTFTVTEVSDFEDTGRAVTTYKIVAMEFRCTLYDADGNSRAVWGRTRGRMIAWQ
jgi:hypothetical protein